MKLFRMEAHSRGKRSALRTRQLAQWGMANKVAPMVYSSRAYADDVAARAKEALGFDIKVYEQDVPGDSIGSALAALRRVANHRCPVCRENFRAITKAIYCSNRCRQMAKRNRE